MYANKQYLLIDNNNIVHNFNKMYTKLCYITPKIVYSCSECSIIVDTENNIHVVSKKKLHRNISKTNSNESNDKTNYIKWKLRPRSRT